MKPKTIKSRYDKLRRSGVDASTALGQLRGPIAQLPLEQRQALVGQLQSESVPSPHETTGRPSGTLSGTLSRTPSPTTSQTVPGTSVPRPSTCAHCGKPNPYRDFYCYACGRLLNVDPGTWGTRPLTGMNTPDEAQTHFASTMMLLLVLKEAARVLLLQPHQGREYVIGRVEGSTVAVDVDLTPYQARERGVSRHHVAITRAPEHHCLMVRDLQSDNGTYLNGQRLRPAETRVLSHGDDLRLGQLELLVHFHQLSESAPKGIG
jgi:hypothetical protein